MESKESPKIRWFIYILVAVVITAIIFACIFRIDEYIKVTGEVKTQNTASSVLSVSNCKLKEILVSEGQNVKAGDVLFGELSLGIKFVASNKATVKKS